MFIELLSCCCLRLELGQCAVMLVRWKRGSSQRKALWSAENEAKKLWQNLKFLYLSFIFRLWTAATLAPQQLLRVHITSLIFTGLSVLWMIGLRNFNDMFYSSWILLVDINEGRYAGVPAPYNSQSFTVHQWKCSLNKQSAKADWQPLSKHD